ncbi:hypothetical protein [Streptomyces sp. LN245]|uniref:hypothetical protein n=1 Tax=Streptomyces sp. LN245 TaxID=3112975 RepID=UPI003713717D
MAPEPVPAGTRLLHIGPHETGTTSVQGALFAAKDAMAAHGVRFPAHGRHPMEAALAVCGQARDDGRRPAKPSGTGGGSSTRCTPPATGPR